MRRMFWVANLLWSLIGAGTAACGRHGFDSELPDASSTDAAPQQAALALPSGYIAAKPRCGVLAPETSDAPLTNMGTSDVVITEATATGGFSLVTPMPVTIPAGATVMLSLRSPIAVIGTDRPGDVKAGVLRLTSDDGVTHELAVETLVLGAAVAFLDPNQQPLSINMMASGGACPAPIQGQVQNTGNQPMSLELIGGFELQTSGFSTGTLQPGETATFQVSVYTSSACSGTGVITYMVTGDFCDPAPPVLQGTFEITGSSTCSCS